MVPSVVIRPLVVVLAVVGVLLMVVVLMLRVLPAHPALELLDHRLSTLLRQRRGGVLTRIFVSILVRHETERIQTQVGEGFPLRKLLGLGFGGTVVVPTLLVLGIAFVRLLRVKGSAAAALVGTNDAALALKVNDDADAFNVFASMASSPCAMGAALFPKRRRHPAPGLVSWLLLLSGEEFR